MGLGSYLLFLGILLPLRKDAATIACNIGWEKKGNTCIDIDECMDSVCDKHAECFNTNGSYYCSCYPGFHVHSASSTYTGFNGTCHDINECRETPDICGDNASCHNTAGSHICTCTEGYIKSTIHTYSGANCEDVDECAADPTLCGERGSCHNMEGSFNCTCEPGYSNYGHNQGQCTDVDECAADHTLCGERGSCHNMEGSFNCTCEPGYSNYGHNQGQCTDVDECAADHTLCGERGSCHNMEGSFNCTCEPGYSNFGHNQGQCAELKCDQYMETGASIQTLPDLEYIASLMRNSCLELGAGGSGQLNGETLLEKLFTKANNIMSGGPPETAHDVSALLASMENAMRLIGPQMRQPKTRIETNHTDAELLVWRGRTPPQGPVSVSTGQAKMDIHWETAAGNGAYPGFTMISLVSYKGLESVMKHSFLDPEDNRSSHCQINSKVATASVSNLATDHLDRPVNFTLSHLKSQDGNYTCVFWDSRSGQGGLWSKQGCEVVRSNATHTVCSCTHLSSFAVLMALHDLEDVFQLKVITWVGLLLSLVCLLLCIITFRFCRSIQSTRNTIHLHLCICLFIADLVFLAGISRTEDKVGCGVVAGLLHYFFLAAFCWMLLEGVQLYRMVVLVFNTTLKPLLMIAIGYGIPAAIVVVSALANARGYGTDRHCWLNLEDGFIWSFFGPVCIIIIINVFFFIITVWKLALKFSSLNPDMNNLRKIRTFTVTAIAQLCVLGTMWISGCFQFEGTSLVASYLFTIFNSLQGALVFIMHCLLSKQVREEYARLLPCICGDLSEKKKYSEYSSSHQSSSSQGFKSLGSGQNTGESQI